MVVVDRGSAGLRGPIAVCETEQVERQIFTSESFRRDGKLIERRGRSRAGPEWSTLRRYDAGGRVIEEEHTGFRPQILTYRYDVRGRLQRIDIRRPDGSERIYESYLYFDDQTSAVTRYIDPPLRDTNTVVAAESMLDMSADAVCILTAFDRSGRPVKRVLYDADERVIRRVLLQYNRSGKLMEEGEAESGGRLNPDLRNLYRYDAAGRCVEVEMHWGAIGGRREINSYNERGDLKEEHVLPVKPEIELFETPPWVTLYDYEYDTQGNWTLRSAQIRGAESTAIIRTDTTRRTFEYWSSATTGA